ncbi:hypothetical protein BC832DRAFT_607216 [Gaertneriomyces semiglobifer]|nr:hypothetical protein BC832DRAFT_607216 [Gaertneriomyces semiglobifer]
MSTETIIKLQVGERRFVTTKETLIRKSIYFDVLLGEDFKKPDSSLDGHIFVDRSGDLFEHVLQYMRTDKLPLFHDPANGFNHGLYTQLRDEAIFYGMSDLDDQLKNKNYIYLVTTHFQILTFPATIDGQSMNLELTKELRAVSTPNRTVSLVQQLAYSAEAYHCARHKDHTSPEQCFPGCRGTKGQHDGSRASWRNKTFMQTVLRITNYY